MIITTLFTITILNQLHTVNLLFLQNIIRYSAASKTLTQTRRQLEQKI